MNGSSERMQGKPYLECQLVPIEGKSDGGLECLSKSVILHPSFATHVTGVPESSRPVRFETCR